MNEPDGHRVAMEFPVAGLDRGDDDEDGVQSPKDGEEEAANVERPTFDVEVPEVIQRAR